MTKKSMPLALLLVILFQIPGLCAIEQKLKPSPAGEDLFRGGFLKFGLMTSPQVDGLGNKWIAAIGFDKMIIPYLAWGLEFQPYFRSGKYPDFKFSTFTGNLFLNFKGGFPAGKLIKMKALKFLNPLKVFAGLGAGTELAFTSFTIEGDSSSQFKARFAWHMVFGVEYAIGKGGLILEIQPVRVIHSELEPSTIKYSYIMLGIRF